MRTKPRATSAYIEPIMRPLTVRSRKNPTLASDRSQASALAGRPDQELGLERRLPSVLIRDDGRDRHRRALREERLDDVTVLLRDEPAPHLARAGDLLVVGVELLVQEHVLREARRLRQVTVDAVDLLRDQVVDFLLLREVGVRRVRDLPLLGPFPHVF